jgi:ribose 5-phosphate isomerase B
MREHNDTNVIAFGQDHMNYEDIIERLNIFLHTDFLAGYHCARIQQMSDIENGKPIKQSPLLGKGDV